MRWANAEHVQDLSLVGKVDPVKQLCEEHHDIVPSGWIGCYYHSTLCYCRVKKVFGGGGEVKYRLLQGLGLVQAAATEWAVK